MSETPLPKPKGNGSAFLRKKVGGIPMLYIVGGAAVILAVVAWQIKPSAALAAEDAATATDAETDAAIPSGSSLLPTLPSGTVVVAPQQPAVAETPYEDNSTWLRKGVTFLISKGKNPGDAQLALQHYLAGANLSYSEGELRDMVVREFGLPPDGFDAGTTAPRPVTSTPVPLPSTPTTPTTTTPPTTTGPVVVNPVATQDSSVIAPSVNHVDRTYTPPATPSPSRVVTPVRVGATSLDNKMLRPVPKPVRYYVVRSGDTLSKIAGTYHTTWQKLYAIPANRQVIGNNPNAIRPGMRLVVG